MNIFTGVAHFFIGIALVITSVFHPAVQKPKTITHVSPTPTHSITITPTPSNKPVSKVLGTETKAEPTPTYVYTPPTQTPTPTQSPIPTNTPVPIQTNADNNTQTQPADYSFYQISLQATLNSLQGRLSTVRNQANLIPQNLNTQISNIQNTLSDQLANVQMQENQAIAEEGNLLARRGIVPSTNGISTYYEQQMDNAKAPYEAQKIQLQNQANVDIQSAKDQAVNAIYQADSQDKDLSSKISFIMGLINKIQSGSFSNSDIPLALQANNY